MKRLALVAILFAACSTDPGRATFYEQNALSTSSPPPPGAPPPNKTGAPFFGTDPFAPGTATHDSKSAASPHPDGGAGLECLGCHVAGGQAQNHPWAAAGTVYSKKKGGQPVGAGVEVRINDAQGNKVASAFTDTAGNFVFESTVTIGTGHVGVRGAATESIMGSSPGGNCNMGGCHGEQSTTGRVSVDPN